MAGITPSQTVGPYFHYGLTPHDYDLGEVFSNNLVTPDASGERIRIEGRVFDGDGQGINDSLVEIWQADSAGRYAHSADRRALPNASFKGFGRCDTDKNGAYHFDTVMPGAVPGPNGAAQAPHIACCATFTRASTSPMKRRRTPTRSSRWCRRTAARR
jgi:protocatechuate 3,4-dioxygenase, alpha subunit